jgi:N-methylhydantoinase A/oxoprolinase/acetone carboxylase beta subunit
MRRAFESAHKSRFGFTDRAKAIAIEAVSVEALGGAACRAEPPKPVERRAFDDSLSAIGRAPRSRARDAILFAWALARGECLCA